MARVSFRNPLEELTHMHLKTAAVAIVTTTVIVAAIFRIAKVRTFVTGLA